MRRFAFALLLSGVVAGGMVVFAQDCAGCRPVRVAGFELDGNYTVCIEHDPAYPYQNTSDGVSQVTALKDGVERYLNDHFASSASQIWFTFIEAPKGQCSNHQMTVDIDPNEQAAARAYWTWDGHGAKVSIADEVLTAGYSAAHWNWLGAHEFTHLLGYDNH